MVAVLGQTPPLTTTTTTKEDLTMKHLTEKSFPLNQQRRRRRHLQQRCRCRRRRPPLPTPTTTWRLRWARKRTCLLWMDVRFVHHPSPNEQIATKTTPTTGPCPPLHPRSIFNEGQAKLDLLSENGNLRATRLKISTVSTEKTAQNAHN